LQCHEKCLHTPALVSREGREFSLERFDTHILLSPLIAFLLPREEDGTLATVLNPTTDEPFRANSKTDK
jgi:hypothetical protein